METTGNRYESYEVIFLGVLARRHKRWWTKQNLFGIRFLFAKNHSVQLATHGADEIFDLCIFAKLAFLERFPPPAEMFELLLLLPHHVETRAFRIEAFNLRLAEKVIGVFRMLDPQMPTFDVRAAARSAAPLEFSPPDMPGTEL